MAVTQNQYTGNGSTVLFSFTFPYLASTDVKVKVDGTDTTAFTLANATTVQMNAAPANGAVVIVYRDTDNDNKKATFYPGSAIKAEDLNNDFDQILYVSQEVDNNALNSLGTSPMQGNLSMGNNKLTNLATPTAGTDAANKTYVDNQSSAAIDSALAAGTDLSKTTSSGITTFAHNVTGANQTINNSNGTVLQDVTVTAQGHVTSVGSTDLDNRYYTKTTLDGGHFDGRYYTETELNAGQLNNQYYTETELDAGQLDNRYYTETELNAGQLDNRYYTEAELNAGQLDSRYFRQDSSETISQGDTWSGSDNYIATTAAIDARITDLVEEVGGFVPIDNETSFPTSNPDINNGAGTLISIKAMSSSRTPSGGVVTISDGAGSGVTVTINGCGTTVLTAGYGVILETTSTTHTYNFHRLSPSTTSITTVSDNISNINAVANNETNINAVNNNSTNINAVANNNSNITAVAGNATNINAVAPNVSNISAVNANATNINTVADNNSNINTVAGAASNISTVATNISSVNNFADRYRVADQAPSSSLDVGDLYFDTTGNELKVYNGSAWQGGVTATGNLVSKSGDEFTGNITFSGSQTVDGRDLSVDGAKLDTIASNANNYAISSDLLDQDDMVSNSATKVPSQQSVKAYVDNQTLSLIDEDDMSTDSATRPPSQQSVKAYADTKAPKASPAFTGTATGVNLTLSGDLTVNGTTTTLNSTTVSIDDKNLELGKVATPTDTTADGGGITLKGGTDKTITWSNATDTWDFNQGIKIAGGLTVDTNTLHVNAADNRIGIGTSSPTSILHIESSNPSVKFVDTDGSGGFGMVGVNNTSGSLVMRSDDGDSLADSYMGFEVDGGRKMTIDSSGQVGIGLTAPQRQLVLYENSSNQTQIQFQNSTTGAAAGDGFGIGLDGDEKGFLWNYEGNDIYIGGSGGTALTLDGSSQNATFAGQVAIPSKSTTYEGLELITPSGDGSGEFHIGVHQSGSSAGRSIVFSRGGTDGMDTESMRIDSSGVVRVGGTDTYNASDKMTLVGSGNTSLTIDATPTSEASVFFADGPTGTEAYRGYVQYKNAFDSLVFGTAATQALTIDSSQNATFEGTVSDSKGNLRSIPLNNQSSAYTLVAADAGKTVSSNGGTITVNGNVMSSGDAVTLINNSGSDMTITQGSGGISIYNTADASTGNRTLAQRGMATIYFFNATVAYISGAGLS